MRLGEVIRRLVPPGSYLLILFFLTGIWLSISPFAMTTQPAGERWITSTITTVTIGSILMLVSLLGILSFMSFALRDLIREAQAKQVTEQSAHDGTAPASL